MKMRGGGGRGGLNRKELLREGWGVGLRLLGLRYNTVGQSKFLLAI